MSKPFHADPQSCVFLSANRFNWEQGYATETMRALFDFGFSEPGLQRVADAVDPANVASIRVLGKLGLRREGDLHAATWSKDRWWDEYIMLCLSTNGRQSKVK